MNVVDRGGNPPVKAPSTYDGYAVKPYCDGLREEEKAAGGSEYLAGRPQDRKKKHLRPYSRDNNF